ncbi:hypothetical protein G6M14_09040 [Agrobacterium tumefaciens]|uniref:hypothetical protein n=1 Tax=Agrobacterium tumefaciens TaxID=358 RepID=UPI0015722D53|nr:hypothetical protein [Agrobacterium tumefaciens]
MAKTPAEYQRAYRERKKAQEKAERPVLRPMLDPLQSAPTRSFADFYRERQSTILFPESLEWVGVETTGDLANEPPKLEKADLWKEQGIEVNSLAVAAARMEVFIDAAKELAELINAYKLEEIDRQMQNASPVKKGQLEALKKRLAKKTSHFFPVIE